MTPAEVVWFALIQASGCSSCRNDCLHQYPAQFNSPQGSDCSGKQGFYCLSEFLKVHPSTLGSVPVPLSSPDSAPLVEFYWKSLISKSRDWALKASSLSPAFVLRDPEHSSGPRVLLATWPEGICLLIHLSITQRMIPPPPCSKEPGKLLRPGFHSGTCGTNCPGVILQCLGRGELKRVLKWGTVISPGGVSEGTFSTGMMHRTWRWRLEHLENTAADTEV